MARVHEVTEDACRGCLAAALLAVEHEHRARDVWDESGDRPCYEQAAITGVGDVDESPQVVQATTRFGFNLGRDACVPTEVYGRFSQDFPGFFGDFDNAPRGVRQIVVNDVSSSGNSEVDRVLRAVEERLGSEDVECGLELVRGQGFPKGAPRA